mmetsp:Transcript_18871/g.13689  ORF Transcript_18871/g.13689 Transcript_18871/m.13689 type:complete len:97 (+) Transcript_18871:794-1084(+)
MSFFLGSLFYPKTMKNIYAKQTQKLKQIDVIHNMLSRFSAKNMKKCLCSSFIARLLLKLFIESCSTFLLEHNQTMKKAKEDYEWGFKYLMTLFGRA